MKVGKKKNIGLKSNIINKIISKILLNFNFLKSNILSIKVWRNNEWIRNNLMKPEPSKKKHFKYYLKCIIVSIIIMLHWIFLLLYFISG
jgi:hypothetical protein